MDYFIAGSVKEAVGKLRDAGGEGMVIAGGTDLMIDLEEGKKKARTLVDVTRIPEMRVIEKEGDTLVIGAAVPLAEISSSPLVREFFPSLARGAGVVGSLQIRNVATLVGNIVTAQPAADAAMAVAPLAPLIEIHGPKGIRQATMDEMYAGFGRSTLDSTSEVVTSVRIPCPKKGEAASFVRLELRKSLSLPMLNAAAMAHVFEGTLKWTRITMGPVGVGPKRARQAEEWFSNKPFTIENIRTASGMVLMDAKPRSNPLRGSQEYREQTLPVIVRRAFEDIAGQLGIAI